MDPATRKTLLIMGAELGVGVVFMLLGGAALSHAADSGGPSSAAGLGVGLMVAAVAADFAVTRAIIKGG